ncbi:MAG: sugar ABC transporter ATP-binding protein [Actinobacteria bacterium]|nr:sugar ABC transporter ATP-binding protein [Actinomycetota bacterium]
MKSSKEKEKEKDKYKEKEKENSKLLELRNITKTFPGVKALDNVDFDLFAGECHALVGENGAGKSTLVKIIAGEYKQDTGEIYICGNKVNIQDTHHAQELGVAFVPQEFQLIPYLNGVENIFLGRLLRGRFGNVNWRLLKKKAQELLDSLEWKIDLSVSVKNLSVAEMQIIQIARAISMDARVFIFDEPTAMLGEKEIERLFDLMNLLKEKGIGIIYISHRLAEIFPICERVTILRDGKVIGTSDINKISIDEIIKMMLGRSLEESFPERNPSIGQEVLKVEKLSKRGVFKNISFKLREGEVLGIAGLIGAGKTELVCSIFGKLLYDEGEIFIRGKEVAIKSPDTAISYGIALIPDDRRNEGLIMSETVRENISITILEKLKRLLLIDRKAERKKVVEIVDRLDIRCASIEQKVGYLSGGNQQKVVLGKWLIANSDILIFDEPTKGIDVGAKRQFYQIINELSRSGKAIIVISQELEELIGLTHRILVLAKGKVVAELDTEKTDKNEIMKYAVGSFR